MVRTHLFILFFGIQIGASAQVEARLSLENQAIIGSAFLFDVYLATINPSSDLYLGNADFVITFNAGMFLNPIVSKVGPNPGFCTFKPTESSPIAEQFTRQSYYNNTSVTIDSNTFIINLSSPNPSDLDGFNFSVAQIDGSVSMHCLGRFKISGIIDPNSNADLRWKTMGAGLNTKVFSLLNSSPFTSSPVLLQTDTNTCPETMSIVQSPINSGHYQAEIELNSMATAQAGASISLSAGDHLILNSNFEVPLGTTLLMNIQGCE
jgi:hypothetical protein